MDAWDLKVFETVARLLGMNRAAAELNTVQSNVTTRIRLLEAELGATLFERHAKGLKLTPAGMRLLPHAIGVRAAIENARRSVTDEGAPVGPLAIGAMPATVALHVAKLLSDFAAKYRKVDVSLETGTSTALIDDVLERRIEGAFVPGPVEHPELMSETVYSDELAVFSAPGLADLKSISMADTKLIVTGKGCSYRRLLEEILTKRGLVGFHVLEFGTLDAILGCVSAGLGITLLPRAVLGPVWREGSVRMHKLTPEDRMEEMLFVRRRDGFFSSALSAFLDSVHASLPLGKPARLQRKQKIPSA